MPDGTYQSVAGRQIPYHAIRLGDAPGKGEIPITGNDLIMAYHNDNGDQSHFASGTQTPSTLDDITMASSGQNAPWRHLTVFWKIDQTSQFLARWQVWDTHVDGQPQFESSWEDLIADFGGFFSRGVPGFYMITFDIGGQINVTVPDGDCGFAQQFRLPDPSGEGDFIDWVEPGFGGGGPDTGSSEDIFWLDDGDGIYNDFEEDNFGGPPHEANYLLGIEVGGTQSVLTPVSFSFYRGSLISGDLGSLWFSDNDALKARPGFAFFAGEFPLQTIIETIAPTNNILTLKFALEASVSAANIVQKIELYNFSTNRWVVFDTEPATQTDSVVNVIVTQNPAQYVNAANHRLRAKVSYRPVAGVLAFPWSAGMDQTVWTVTTP
jgi:hypothetical protein